MENQNKEFQQETQFAQLRRELRATRIFCAVTSLLLVCVLAGSLVAGLVVYDKVKSSAAVAGEIIQQLEGVDYESLAVTIENANKMMEVLYGTVGTVDWQRMSEQIAALDVEAINQAIADLDTAELTRALETLNDVVETLESISGSFHGLFGGLGRS